MSKVFLFLTVILFGSAALFAQSYEITTEIDQGNPEGFNEEGDNSSGGWTKIFQGPATENIWSEAQTIPFDFKFYGSPVTHFKFSLNGLITFDTSATGTPANNNTSLPNADLPDSTIACFWDEFAISGEASGRVFIKTFGEAPFRQFWIKYFSFEYNAYDYAYFSVMLEETSNSVYFIDHNEHYDAVGSATVGVQLDSSNAVQHPDSPDYVFLSMDGWEYSNNDYHHFFPSGSTLGLATNPSPADDAINENIESDLSWTFAAGTEYYDLYFDTNYPPSTKVVDNAVAGTTGSYAPGTLLNDTTYYWRVVGRNGTEEVAGRIWNFETVMEPIELPFLDSFEIGFSNWTVEGTSTSIRVITSSMAHSGTNAVRFSADQDGFETSSISIRLAAGTDPVLSFWYWISSSTLTDVTVDIKGAGATEWTTAIWDMDPSGVEDEYVNVIVDLSQYNTETGDFWIRLNGTGYKNGYMVTEVVIMDDVEVVSNSVPTSVEIGSGTGSWVYPLYTYNMDARLQTIYYADEFQGALKINSVSLDVYELPGTTLENLYIRMKETVADSLPLFDNSGLAQVVHHENVTIDSTGWWEITLDTPFYYSASSNLLIDFCIDNSIFSTSGRTMADEYKGTSRSCGMWSWLESGDLLNYASNVEIYDYANNIRFKGEIWTPSYGTLKGIVAEYGTGKPVKGATIEIVDLGYKVLSDSTGYYAIDSLVTGTYNFLCTAPGYIDSTAHDISISYNITTTVNFALTWPEITITPSSISETLEENDVFYETFNIENSTNGGGNLTYSCMFSETSDTTCIADENAKRAPIISVGTPIPLDELEQNSLSMKINSQITVDKNLNVSRNPSPLGIIGTLGGEEVFGNDDYEYYGDYKRRGNFFTCKTSTVLEEHRFYLHVPTSTKIYFSVFEGDAQVGVYNLMSYSEIAAADTGKGWYSSGIIAEPLTAGKFYLITASWIKPCYYYIQKYVTPYPYPASFGELTGTYGWSWVGKNYFPPPDDYDVPSRAFGDPIDVAWYQTLVTSSSWFEIKENGSGTIPPGGNVDVTYALNSEGLNNIIKKGKVTVYVNVGEDVTIPVTMNVGNVGIEDVAIPKNTKLNGNYPNPFNPVTTIEYQLSAFSKVELVVYNILGQKVRTLVNKKQAAGKYKLSFNASGLASGLYIYKMQTGDIIQSRKMLLIR